MRRRVRKTQRPRPESDGGGTPKNMIRAHHGAQVNYKEVARLKREINDDGKGGRDLGTHA